MGFALAALLGFACVNLFLDKDIRDLKEKNERLTKDYTTVKNNLSACDTALASQNEAIKAATVKIDDTPSKEAERIKKIYVKDKSCESELAAYKELFK